MDVIMHEKLSALGRNRVMFRAIEDNLTLLLMEEAPIPLDLAIAGILSRARNAVEQAAAKNIELSRIEREVWF